jgi:hypothetical protein
MTLLLAFAAGQVSVVALYLTTRTLKEKHS